MDTEDRRYFKQQEIILWRKGEKQRKPNLQAQGTLVASHLVKNEPHVENKENENTTNNQQQQTTIKEDFTRANNSQSTENIHNDSFEKKDNEAPIENMQREAGDGQIDTGASTGQWCTASHSWQQWMYIFVI